MLKKNIVIVMVVVLGLLTFYIISASIENHLAKKALDALIIQNSQTYNAQ